MLYAFSQRYEIFHPRPLPISIAFLAMLAPFVFSWPSVRNCLRNETSAIHDGDHRPTLVAGVS